MMKKHVSFLAGCLFLMSCSSETPVQHIATGEPIKPVRFISDTANIFLTDYVPSLMAQNGLVANLDWLASEPLEVILAEDAVLDENALPEQMALVNHANAIQMLVIFDNKEGFNIPVLPAKPAKNALVSESYADGLLTVRFMEPVSNPSFVAFVQNLPVSRDLWQVNEDGSWTLRLSDSPALAKCSKGRAFLRIYAEDDTYLYNDLLIPLQDGVPVTDTKQLTRHDDNAQVLYSILIDRFHNGNTANDWKLNSPEVLDIVDYQGGDFAGITAKINEGFFDRLGVNTLWISPITQNPWDAWGHYEFHNGNKYDSTKTYTKFSAYHGYWPIYNTALEQRFGTPEEFKTLLNTAHAHGMNVILDYVANHMHINSPTLRQHPTWITDSILPDGRRNFELWDEARLTTWFDAHIPTLDLEREDVCQPMTDTALYWMEHYDVDGYRHDACKHIPEGYWRMLGQKIAARYPDRHVWMIGETYGDPSLINSYVKTGMLNAQFDFNMYYSAIHTLCGEGSMTDIANTIHTSLATYGAHHTMGNISGNHDQPRFASFAGGAIAFNENGKEVGWTRNCGLIPDDTDPNQRFAYNMAVLDLISRTGDKEIADPKVLLEDEAYKRALLLEVLNLTLPGVPCIYQGDEYAETGANDPDNRHMVGFDNLREREQAFRSEVSSLIQMRRSSMPLLYGDYIPVSADNDVLCFDRVYLGERVRVTIDRKNLTYTIQ